jgi:hypothetical protein
MQTHVAEAIENYVSGAADAGVVGNLQAVFYAERQHALEQWPFDGSAICLKADSEREFRRDRQPAGRWNAGVTIDT